MQKQILSIFLLIITSVSYAQTESYGDKCPDINCPWRKPIIDSPPDWREYDIPNSIQPRISFIPNMASFGMSLISANAFHKQSLKIESRNINGYIDGYRKSLINQTMAGINKTITEKPSFITKDGREVKMIALETTLNGKKQIELAGFLEEDDVILTFTLSSPSLESFTASYPSFKTFVNSYYEKKTP
jgi:hypothetical protein